MTGFQRQHGELHAESVPLSHVAAQYGTPAYVYSKAAITAAYQRFASAFAQRPHQICYAVKANSNIALLSHLAGLGAGFDIVSGGELQRVLKAGGDPQQVIFSGVGKEDWELDMALKANIACFNMESASELARIQRLAKAQGRPAPVAVRVNPDIDPGTHPYIATGRSDNKFGMPPPEARELLAEAAASPHTQVVGIGCHLGSQILSAAPYLQALEQLLALAEDLAKSGIPLKHLDLGGGMAIPYQDEPPFDLPALASAVSQALGARSETLILEPGRALVAEAGLLLTRVNTLKQNGSHHFAVVDAAMNDLLRPALYQAWQPVQPVLADGTKAKDKSKAKAKAKEATYDLVGPICESGDFLAKARRLRLAEGDLLAIMSAGAYGFAMSSNYNTRPRPPEILVDGAATHLIRRRETLDDLLSLEALPSGS